MQTFQISAEITRCRQGTIPRALVENVGNLNLTFTLSAVAPLTITVDYATSNGSAKAGSDYTAQGGTLTFLRLRCGCALCPRLPLRRAGRGCERASPLALPAGGERAPRPPANDVCRRMIAPAHASGMPRPGSSLPAYLPEACAPDIPHTTASNWGSQGRSPGPGVQGWRPTLAARRVGERLMNR